MILLLQHHHLVRFDFDSLSAIITSQLLYIYIYIYIYIYRYRYIFIIHSHNELQIKPMLLLGMLRYRVLSQTMLYSDEVIDFTRLNTFIASTLSFSIVDGSLPIVLRSCEQRCVLHGAPSVPEVDPDLRWIHNTPPRCHGGGSVQQN